MWIKCENGLPYIVF